MPSCTQAAAAVLAVVAIFMAGLGVGILIASARESPQDPPEPLLSNATMDYLGTGEPFGGNQSARAAEVAEPNATQANATAEAVMPVGVAHDSATGAVETGAAAGAAAEDAGAMGGATAADGDVGRSPPGPRPLPRPAALLEHPNEMCIANRGDNMLDVGVALSAACQSFGRDLGLEPDELSCEPWYLAEGAAPPRSCVTAWDKSDWVFSTLYQRTGRCVLGSGEGPSASKLVNRTDLPRSVKPLCAAGWDGAPGYDTSL